MNKEFKQQNMNKKLAAILCAVMAGSGLFAQNRVLDVREAHPGRDLTMEEAIYKGVGYSRFYSKWTADGLAYIQSRGQEWQFYALSSSGTEDTDRYSYKEENGTFTAIKDGKEYVIAAPEGPGIVYGGTAMRNEFGFETGYLESPSGQSVAIYRKDESRVQDFPMMDLSSPGSLKMIKYPMNGEVSERLEILLYNFTTGSRTSLKVTDFEEDRYITNLAWSPDEKYIYAQVLDRSQHHMHLNCYRVKDGSFVRTLLTEENDAWVEPLDPVYFLDGRTDLMIYRTDNRDGFRNLYLVDTLGKIRNITPVKADVAYVGNNGKKVFYTSAEVSPIENHLFCVNVKGRLSPQRLTPERGWHEVALSPDKLWFSDSFSSFGTPAKLEIASTDGRKRIPVASYAADPLEGIASCRMELGTVPSADGKFDNYYRLYYPKDFDPGKKYPLIVYVYGGPHSQMVQDSWLGGVRMWEMLMAQKGYMVYVQDNRGTSNRGADFEKAINRRCGQAEMEDQMAGIRRLLELPYVDADRVGVHGWSYGGFMTISLMTHYPEVFKAAVAGGPVIDWRFYEIMYGERYMDNPAVNPDGFEETSLLGKAHSLKGKLLICQGAKDDTVVWRHCMSFVQECIDNNVPVDFFVYPVAAHNVLGRNRVHLMDKVSAYFEENL